ncbi:MAG TPA: 3-isopropylmalate dehydratase small subunit [Steroidobacteraceae bacterium]|nr:3-isopropylmalate dehydratase small subunit [Steroidobacteraceae bacterium]
MQAVRQIQSRTVVLPSTNIDTDQIVPARFLTTTTRAGLGSTALFADWRFDAAGKARPEFILNQPASAGCRILVAGNNFGCGSSREHAPWALVDYGFQAVVSTGIADIFRSNSLKNGLVPVVVDASTHAWLLANPGAEMTVDVERSEISLPGGRTLAFALEAFARYCLLHGVDELGYLLQQAGAIADFERKGA